MRNWKAVFTGFAAGALLATPAWAHPATGIHIHVDAVFPALTLGAALVLALKLRRSRPRTG